MIKNMRDISISLEFPVNEYLNRIGLLFLPEANEEGLNALVKAHTYAIPFENLDTLAGERVRLDVGSILEKLLKQNRGGYCFELNGLMKMALNYAGFEVHSFLSRVTYRRNNPGPLSHEVLIVKCNGKDWLVDTGFGGPGLTVPMKLVADKIYEQAGARFLLSLQPDDTLLLQREIDGVWVGLYLISKELATPLDIEMSNYFVSTYPNSPFRNRFMCVKTDENGMWKIENFDLIRLNSRHEIVQSSSLNNHQDFEEAINSVFGLTVPIEIATKAWLKVKENCS